MSRPPLVVWLKSKNVFGPWALKARSPGQRRRPPRYVPRLEILEDRYGRGATLVTSQLPVDRWHDVIGDPTFGDAILDRLVHNAHRLQLRGDSLRKRVADEPAP